MTKIFLDTNIWLRFFLKDNDQYPETEKLLNAVEEGKFLPYTSNIIFLEIAFVLGRTYKIAFKKVAEYLQAILETRNITVIEETNTKVALKYFSDFNIKFSDCLIASQIVKDMTLVTFDEDFKKITNLKTKTPSNLEF